MENVETIKEPRRPKSGNGGDDHIPEPLVSAAEETMERQEAPERQPDLLDLWRTVWSGKGLLIRLVVAAICLSLVASLFMTTKYRARTSIMPLSGFGSGLGSLIASMSDLPMISGMARQMGVESPNSKLLTLLGSRTLTESVITKLNLMPILFDDEWDEEAGAWEDPEDAPNMALGVEVMQKGVLRFHEDDNDAIVITALWRDPDLAADIANQYVAELERFLNENAMSIAKRNRMFVEQQLEQSKAELASSEETLVSFQKEKNLFVFDAQAMAGVEIMANLQAQLMSKDIEIGVLRRFASDSNPKVMLVINERNEIRAQMKKLAEGGGGADMSVFPPINQAPELGLQFGRLKRDAVIEEAVFELLTKQHEIAKIEEARDQIAFQVIDLAVPPEKKARPRIALNMAVGGGSAGILGVFYLFLVDYIARLRRKREQA